MSLLSFIGFFRFITSFCRGEFNLSKHLLLRFWKLPHLQGQLLLLLLPELYVFSANILIIRFFDDISSFNYLISSLKFVQQFMLSSEFSLSILLLTSNMSSIIIANWASCFENFVCKWFNWSSSFTITGSVEVQPGVSVSSDFTGNLGISSETILWLSFLERLKESHPDESFYL